MLMGKEGAQVPEVLREAWAVQQDVVVSYDGARIDFHGGGNALVRPRHFTENELAKVTDAFVVSLVHPKVTSINVTICKSLTDESMKAIAKGCPELKELNVSWITNLTDESFKAIAKGCPELKELNAWGVENLTDESMKAIAKGCPELTELNVAGIGKLTDESIKAIAKGCPELKQLNVAGIENLTDESIMAIAEGCPELEGLTVLCYNLTDDAIMAIAKGCPELKELNVSECENLTDESVKAIAIGCPKLKELNVGGMENLTDESMKAIARGCPGLKALGVSWCRRLSASSIKAIAQGCPELKKLNVSECRTNDSWMKAISEGLPGLEELNANLCYVESLPADFFGRLSQLILLDIRNNKLTSLPPSIVKHKHLRQLNVSGNPLQSPPHELATQGLDAIKRYFEELERGSSVSKLLKVVLVGDGEAGKTSLRNALAGRPNPRQEDRTIHLDIEKITLTNDLDINVYDCGGQEEYITTQLPYLTGLALYMVVVEAQYATDEYAHVVEDKLHRFLVVLQNRVPGAVVLPIVTKVDTVEDPETRCHWLESAIEKWMQHTRKTVCQGLPEASVDRQKPPLLGRLPSAADDMRTAGNGYKRNFIPLRVQLPALAVSVADANDVKVVHDSVKAVIDRIVALTMHNPPLLRGVGQQVPSTYMAVLELFGAIAEYGDNDLALEALRHGTAHALGETSLLSRAGIYRPKDVLESIWNKYRDERYVSVKGTVFDDATQLWEAQGLIFVDFGLVFLQPEFFVTLVKPLVDHRYKDKKKFVDHIKRNLARQPHSIYSYNQLADELNNYVDTGEIQLSHKSLFLSFLWRDTGLDKSHYGQVLQMLARSGVILMLERRNAVVVVPFFLMQNLDGTKLEMLWPKLLPPNERELKLHFEPTKVFPTGFAERFLVGVHGLGTSLYSWRTGVVVSISGGHSALAERRENGIHFTVRFESYSTKYADAAWKALCDAQLLLMAQRNNRFPGLFYLERLFCEQCCRTRRRVSTSRFDADRRSSIFISCGHRFDIDSTGEFYDYTVIDSCFNGPVSRAQVGGLSKGVEKNSSAWKLLKVVLVGDGEAGKTFLRNALAGRNNSWREARTNRLDIEKIKLTDDLDINVYDCRCQEEDLATQLPYLTGLALYMVIVEAKYATDEYAHALEDKLHRFLVLLQNRVPGAVVLPIVTEVDPLVDLEIRCQWLEGQIENWLQDTRKMVCGSLPESSVDRLQPPALLPSVANGDDMRKAGTCDKRNFIPLRVQAPALAFSVADTDDVRDSVKDVRDSIIALTKHSPPLLHGIGQQIPSTYMAVLKLFGAIAEYGDNDRALKALCEGTAHALGEIENSKLSRDGRYRPKDELENIWNTYRNEPNVSVRDNVFNDATQLWEAQGLVIVDAGLVILQPEFLMKLVEPLVDDRYDDKNGYTLIKSAVAQFIADSSSYDQDSYNQLIQDLDIFRDSGRIEIETSCKIEVETSRKSLLYSIANVLQPSAKPKIKSVDEFLLLSFLWRNTGLDKSHYGQIIHLLKICGVIVNIGRDLGKNCIAVPCRLPKTSLEKPLRMCWPLSPRLNEYERRLRFQAASAIPAGLSERFVADVHGLGTSLYFWRFGVVVRISAECIALAERTGDALCVTTRFEAGWTSAACKILCHARGMIRDLRSHLFPGFVYEEVLICEQGRREGRQPIATTRIFNGKSHQHLLRPCGHGFGLLRQERG